VACNGAKSIRVSIQTDIKLTAILCKGHAML
jgi:hypothetical protein